MVDTRDNQLVWVGTECAKLVRKAGAEGYQPPKGGPRLYAARFNPDGTVKSTLAPNK